MNIDSVAPKSVFKSGTCRTMSRDRRSWEHVQADLVRRTGLAKEETAITPRRHLLLLNLRGESQQGQHFLDGKPSPFVRRRPGAILFVPAGCNWTGWEAGAPTAAYLSISVDPAFVSEFLGRSGPGPLPVPPPDLGCEDPVIMNAARAIGAEIRDRNPFSALLVESYTATIVAQLLRRQRQTPCVRKGGLAATQLNRVLEKIEDDLCADLSLAQLAALAGVSIPHFCRAFKQTLGCSPHVFVLRRRVERAKQYLRGSSMSVTDVALACGFSSSSHLSNAFRREFGMTPLAYRGSWPEEAAQ